MVTKKKRPKQINEITRSLDLIRVRRHFQKKSGRQTDKHFFFKKTFEMAVHPTKFLLYHSETFKRIEKPLKEYCDGRTDRPTDRRTDGPTKKWLIESRSTRLKSCHIIPLRRNLGARELSGVSLQFKTFCLCKKPLHIDRG